MENRRIQLMLKVLYCY